MCMHRCCSAARFWELAQGSRTLLAHCLVVARPYMTLARHTAFRKTPSRRLRVLFMSAHLSQAECASTRRHRPSRARCGQPCMHMHAPGRAVYTSNATWPQGRRPHTTSATHTAFETLRKMPSTRLRVLPAFHPCRVACCTPRQPRQPATLTQTQTQQTQTQEDASRRSRRRRRRKKTQADARSEDAGR